MHCFPHRRLQLSLLPVVLHLRLGDWAEPLPDLSLPFFISFPLHNANAILPFSTFAVTGLTPAQPDNCFDTAENSFLAMPALTAAITCPALLS
jgi:hypothetical protein